MVKRIFIISTIWISLGIINTSEIMAQKYVTIFYACWANECLNTTYGDDVYIMGITPYSPYPEWNWWGKPLYAATTGDGTIKNNYKLYFDSPDNPNRDLIDRHANLLDSAGIDFITLDLTNGTQTKIFNGAKAICKRYQERYNQGLHSPQIIFWVQDSVCLQKVETEIFNVFQSEIFFEYLGKKLVNVAGGNIQPAIPTEGIFSKYTCRRMWGLNNTGSFWQFKVNSVNPPPPFYYNGEPEQMCAPVATQSTVMTNDGINPWSGAVGRQNGAYFVKYMDAAINAGVKFVFIHSWNEWTAQNLGTQQTPMFVDQWKTEYSSDIEPMYGGHGWDYYDLMREKISEFKNVTNNNDDYKTLFPGSFRLMQNYPNPFNPTTTINYSIPQSSLVSLKVYDILGREVATLVNEVKPVGNYQVVFNASTLASGVYFYRIVVGNFSETKKLNLIK